MPMCLTAKSNQYTMWHQRLGHASHSKLQHLKCVKPFIGQQGEVCITCPMAKLTKQPFKLSHSLAQKAFALVHTDIWGPYKVATRGKYRFFFTLVDDYSRVTWVYLLQRKSDYLPTLVTFKQFVDIKFKGTVQTIRSDNALEFSDKACNEFLAKHGIVHQKSCPYTPQQNARVESKHRHILEVTRALRFQSGFSLSYWGERVVTAVHIINRFA